MSYGYYSLNNLNNVCSGGGTSQTILGEDPVIVQTVGSTSTISLYESSPNYINFEAFDKSLRVDTIYANHFTGPGFSDFRGPTGATGPQGERGEQGFQGPTGPQGTATIPDPLIINNLQVNNFMTGHNAQFSGYVVGQDLIASNYVSSVHMSSTDWQGERIDTMTGTVRNFLEWGDWRINVVNTNQLEVINKNSALPTLLFVPSLNNGYMLSNDIIPSTNTKSIGSLGAKWEEGHFKKIFVDANTIEFNQVNPSGANAYIKSSYINETIDTILGPINLQGNNIQSEYISSTGVFSVYNTSTVSTTLELSTKDLFTDSINALRRDISILSLSGAGYNPQVSITGSNIGGSIQIYTGTGCARNFGIVEIPFIYPYINPPAVIIQPATQSSARLLGDSSVFCDTDTNSFIIYSGNTPLRDLTYYKWFYSVIG